MIKKLTFMAIPSAFISLGLFFMMQSVITPIEQIANSQNIKYSTIGLGNLKLSKEQTKEKDSVFEFIPFTKKYLGKIIPLCNYISFYPYENIKAFKESFNPNKKLTLSRSEILL